MIKRWDLGQGIVGYETGRGKNPVLRAWAYRVGSTLFDTGPPAVESQVLETILRDGPLKHIYVSHHHEDHSGNAAALRQASGASITLSQYCAPLTRQGFKHYPYQKVYWGKFKPLKEDVILELPALGSRTWVTDDGSFIIFHAPGHSHDMSVIWDKERGVLFAADLYLASRLKLMRRDEVWDALEASTKRILRTADFEQLLCAHRPVFENGKAALEKKHTWMLTAKKSLVELVNKGLSLKEASRLCFGNSKHLLARVSLGNVSRDNMAKSALGRFKPRPDVEKIVGESWARCDFDNSDNNNKRDNK